MFTNFKPHTMRKGILALAISQLFCMSAGAAQSEAQRIAELEKKLEKSLGLIEQLSARLNQLEAGKAVVPTSSAVAEKVAAQAERIDQLEKSVVQVSETSAKRSAVGLPLHGFADLGYARESKNPSNRKGGFALGNLDLYLTPEFGDRVKSIAELVFEMGEDGGLATDLERLQLGYTFSDALTLWGGRFHTPYGYWNTAFHHGAQIQTAVMRPRFVAFEDQGGILPAHTVGVLASGATRVGDGKLQYDAYYGNGNSVRNRVLDFNAVMDDNGNKVVGGNVRYQFGGALEGLTLGLHGLTEQVDAYDAGNLRLNSVKLNVYGAFGVLERDNWEVISEYYRFRNDDLSGGTGVHGSWAGFAQVGRTIAERWTPYVRTEKATLDQSDSYFAGLDSGRSYKRHAVGLRYDLNPLSALKMELSRTTEQQPAAEQKSNEARLQFAVRF